MKKVTLFLLTACLILSTGSCKGMPEDPLPGDLEIRLVTGEEWLHEFNSFLDNPPQFVIWAEDEEGNYLKTLYATRKVATEGWVMNKGNRRMEALPYWMHKRNEKDEEGFLLPSKDAPLVDGITGATPKKDILLYITPPEGTAAFRLLLELNHSTDFNRFWPESAEEGDAHWTGGSLGSGQPSVIYEALVDTGYPGSRMFQLAGHGSPDGSDGTLTKDTGSLTSALYILGDASVRVLP